METNMKKIIVQILVAGVVLSSVSCKKFLTEDSKTKLDQSQVYSDVNLIETSLQGAYATWKNTRTDEQGTITMMGTDEIQQGAYQMKSDAAKGGFDRYDLNLNSLSVQLTNQWTPRWKVVNEVARIVDGLEKLSPKPGTREANLLGEAYFVRGFVDYELAMYWGEIPIRDLSRESELGFRRQPLKDVWAFIISDLTKAATLCPATTANSDGSRATIGAAWAILGKAYMSAPEATGLRDFAKAQNAFEQMMNKYSLVPYKDLWDYTKDPRAEVIFTFQFNNQPNNNKVQFQIGSRAVQAFFGDKCYYSGYDKAVPTIHAYETVANGGVWEDGDLRRNESIRYDFTYYGQTPTLAPISWEDLGNDYDELKPHIKKYEDFRTDQHSGLGINNMWNCGKNIPVLRLSDIKLCYAECLNELNKTADANAVVNEVRARAWGGTLPADKRWVIASQDAFRTAMSDERIRELFSENWRRIDLIRTGKFVDRVKTYNKWAKESGTIQSYNTRWPIPDVEMKLNDQITPQDQNQGYR
jgi:hypothetical protein